MLLLALLGSGCAVSAHSAAPYRDDPVAARDLERAAEVQCLSVGEPTGEPSKPFVTDGCTLWPDGNWKECCVEHDIHYWCGGTWEDRERSDRDLKECVSMQLGDRWGGFFGQIVMLGVRSGGAPWLPTSWRWGYGHAYPSRYSARKVSAVSE